MPKKIYSTTEAARICHVERATIIRWIDVGILKAFKTPTGRNKILTEDLVDLLKENKMPIPAVLRELARKLIYVVDDEEDFLYIIKERLIGEKGEAPFDLETFDNGFEALMSIGKKRPDILITDVRMPEMNGYELCKKLKENGDTKMMKIIIISGYLDQELDRFKKNGLADAYLEKPIDFKELRRLITAYADIEF
ncbi:response regulator [bacterium]|nr:response regulator [bacterium]